MLWLVPVATLSVTPLAACTDRQLYDSGQAWKRNHCGKIVDKAEYDRCMAGADTPYEAYKRQRDSEQKR